MISECTNTLSCYYNHKIQHHFLPALSVYVVRKPRIGDNPWIALRKAWIRALRGQSVDCTALEQSTDCATHAHVRTVNCMSVEKCVLRTEVFYHYFSMQPRNMQCTQFFNGPAIDCTVNCRSVEKLRTLHIAWLHRIVMVEDFRTQYAFFNGHAIDCTCIRFTEARWIVHHGG